MAATGPATARGIPLLGKFRIAIKLAAMVAWLLVCIPLHYLWKLGLRLPRSGPRPWPRRFLGGLCRIAGVKVRISGQRFSKGVFLLANHVSWIDIVALSGASGTAFVAHDRLADIPLLRWLCSLNDTVFIARHDRASIHRQVEQVREAIAQGGALTIFPEGTTSSGTGLLPFKSSLLSAFDPPPPGVAVQPVLLDYGPDAGSIAWVGEEPGLDNFLRILAADRAIELTIHFLPPLEGAALAGRKTIAASAQTAIQAALRWN